MTTVEREIIPALVFDAVEEKAERLNSLYERMTDHPPKRVTSKHIDARMRLKAQMDVLWGWIIENRDRRGPGPARKDTAELIAQLFRDVGRNTPKDK